MSKRPKRKNARQSDFKVVVRGVNRVDVEYSRLMQATLEHFQNLSPLEKDSRLRARSSQRKGQQP